MRQLKAGLERQLLREVGSYNKDLMRGDYNIHNIQIYFITANLEMGVEYPSMVLELFNERNNSVSYEVLSYQLE